MRENLERRSTIMEKVDNLNNKLKNLQNDFLSMLKGTVRSKDSSLLSLLSSPSLLHTIFSSNMFAINYILSPFSSMLLLYSLLLFVWGILNSAQGLGEGTPNSILLTNQMIQWQDKKLWYCSGREQEATRSTSQKVLRNTKSNILVVLRGYVVLDSIQAPICTNYSPLPINYLLETHICSIK